jgi:flagellar M-ring protein FliF
LNIREKAAGIYRALPVAHRVMVIASVLVVAMAAYLFMGWVNRPEWSTVYQATDANDLTTALESLNGAGVPNQVSGNTISVPSASLTMARSALADSTGAGGSGASCEGWELLDGGSMTISNAVQDVNIQRAMECELERDLGELDFVRTATVNLALPDEALFAEDQASPTAAVMIDPTRPLSSNEVQTVAAVVASSVEGLDPADVTVTDGENVQSGPGMGGSAGQENLAFTRSVENEGARKVQDMLEGLLGEGMVDVSMSATLNFDQSTVSERTVDPTTAVALARSTVEETYTGEGSPPSGVVGVDGGVDASTGTTGSDYRRVEDVSEFAVSEVYREATESPGRIERMSVAVLMDDGTASGLAAPPSEAQIEALVSAALGLDPARGDAISVTSVPFPEGGLAVPEVPDVAAAAGASPLSMIPKVVGGLVLVVVALGLLLMTRKPKSARVAATDEPQTVPELLAAYEPQALEGGNPRQRVLPAPADPNAERVRDELIDLVERQPEEIALLLRSWLSDRREHA